MESVVSSKQSINARSQDRLPPPNRPALPLRIRSINASGTICFGSAAHNNSGNYLPFSLGGTLPSWCRHSCDLRVSRLSRDKEEERQSQSQA